MPRSQSAARPAATVGPPRRPAFRALVPRRRASLHRYRTAALLAGADCLAAAAASVSAAGTVPGTAGGGPGHGDPIGLALALAVLVAALLPLNAHAGLYRAAPMATALDDLPALAARAATAWCVAAAVVAAVRPADAFGWPALLGAAAAHGALACAARGAVHLGLRRSARRRPRSTLVVGTEAAGRRITGVLYEHPEYGMRPVGVVGTGPDAVAADLFGDFAVPVLTGHEDIARAVIQNAVRDAVLTRDPRSDPETAALVRLFTSHDCTVWLVGDESDAAAGPVAETAPTPQRWRVRGPEHLWGFACRRLDLPFRHRPGCRAKRLLDVVVAAAALVLTAPLFLACALAVRLADGPGVIFRQERVGLEGRPFTVLKFRTLRPADEHESATLWSVADDRRMSAVGRLLRRTSLDELPQLWNVLRGDMSLVGPRPERPYFVRRFSQDHPGYAARHRMPAGITGLAQVHGLRGDTSIEDRARFDNHYIDTWSLWQDVRILLRTAGSLFRFGGS